MTRAEDPNEVEFYIRDLLRDPVASASLPAPDGEMRASTAPSLGTPATELADPKADAGPLAPPQRAALERLLRPPLEEGLARQTQTDQVTTATAGHRPQTAPVTVGPDNPTDVDEPRGSSGHLLAWHENGRPYWAQAPFEALLFEVSGLTLAVPLVVLGQIHPINCELTKVFGQAAWFMGLLPANTGKIRCINTALFVMPERYDERFATTAKYVVSIDGMDWGLAVDNVRQPMTLNPEEVTWRAQRTKRPWLAGTVKSAMCALLDLPQMGELLEVSDRKRRP